MAESKQLPGDHFGVFIDKIQSQEEPNQEPNDHLRSILLLLAKRSPQPILELAKASRLALAEFNAELDAARSAGFVEVTGPSAEEVVALTLAGAQLAARLSQP
jgi:hypothetical protein